VKSGNEQFSRDIAAWTFQESHVLRIDRTEHHPVNATEAPEQYTTNDQLVSFVLVSPVHHANAFFELRCTVLTSQNSMRRQVHGSLFLA
jgi:hypothetical protein